MQQDIIVAVRAELQQQSDTKTKDMAQHYFKEKVVFYGVKTALVSRIARIYFQQVKHLRKGEIFILCEELLKSGYSEEAFIASAWSYNLRQKYEEADFAILENWLYKYVDNWAKCDTLCNHTIGAFMEKYPQYLQNLKAWAKLDNRWLRRAAAVSLIIPARAGKYLDDIIEIADILLLDGDDLVQKGYGWLLKEASRKHQGEVFDYVMRHRAVMPRIALRYAIEKMPADLKHRAMSRAL
ncbi:MAG TPA: DNA alkylation repair protein [Dehalococcoidia bacterium]|nr:DNA alkylation repair protein [Dehalococcoidia bacterium]